MARRITQDCNNQANFDNHGHNVDVAIVMIPLPAQGHLNQLLQLSHLISSLYPSIHVHYAASATHIRQAKLRSAAITVLATSTNVHFHNLPTPPFPSPPPLPPTSTPTSGFPTHLQPTFDAAVANLRSPIATLLRSLSSTVRRLVVIHDSTMAFVVQDYTVLPNVESFSYDSISIFASLSIRWQVSGITPPPEFEADVPALESIFSREFLLFMHNQSEFSELKSGMLYNTSVAIEGPFVDPLVKEVKTRVWAIGPYIAVSHSNQINSSLTSTQPSSTNKCMEWLDKQPAHSVLYISFGTSTTMAKEQIEELAIGLEKSGQKFIWVLRAADRGDVFAVKHNNDEEKDEEEKATILPKGFEERVERDDMGMVVREWAPQVEILGHQATGGFISHCGWNSCLEGLAAGVPMAAWPMHSDQPANAILITKYLKVGIAVREWSKRNEIVTANDVSEVVRRLMMNSKEGASMSKRAAKLGSAIQQSMAKGGESQVALESFITHITR